MEKAGDISDSRGLFNEVGNASFFCECGKKPLSLTASGAYNNKGQEFSQSEKNRILVFRHIERTQPTTRYKIAKETRLDKTTVRLIVRDLVFAGVVHQKTALHDNGKTYKILSIPEASE